MFINPNKYALQSMRCVLQNSYDGKILYKESRSGKDLQLYRFSCATKYINEKYSVEERFLISFAEDLAHNFSCIKSIGVVKLADVCKLDCKDSAKQNYFDFCVTFENLIDKMEKFRWSVDKLAQNGIDYNAYHSLYIAIS